VKTVILELLDGSHVWALKMPPFLQQPEVIVWGARTFVKRTCYETDAPNRYREVFCWWAPPSAQEGAPLYMGSQDSRERAAAARTADSAPEQT
jgi:hypothetical protein